MKKTILLSILLMLFKAGFGQWRIIDAGTNYRINKVIAIDSNIMLLVGDSSTIRRSDDKGEHWQKIPFALSCNIYDINCSSPWNIFLLTGGDFYRSTDTGLTWQYRWRYKNPDSFYKFEMVNDSYYYAFSYFYEKWGKEYVYDLEKSVDSGRYWSSAHDAFRRAHPTDMAIISLDSIAVTTKIMFVTTHTAFHITNNNYFPLELSEPYFPLDALQIPERSIAYAVNDSGYIVKMHHPFENESKIFWYDTLFHDSHYSFNELLFINSDTGFVVGDSGLILRTMDGGQSWLKLNSGVSVNLINLVALPSGEIFAYGEDGILLKTNNLGGTGDTVVSSVTKINDLRIRIYPNPVGSVLTIKVNERGISTWQVQLLDMHGRTISETKHGQPTINIPVKELKPGVYFIKISNSKQTVLKKIIKAD